jgi:hypothetical protein
LTCKAQRKFHPSIPNFYLKRHLGYSLTINSALLFPNERNRGTRENRRTLC